MNDSITTMNILGPQEAFANKLEIINTSRKVVRKIETFKKINLIKKSKILLHKKKNTNQVIGYFSMDIMELLDDGYLQNFTLVGGLQSLIYMTAI